MRFQRLDNGLLLGQTVVNVLDSPSKPPAPNESPTQASKKHELDESALALENLLTEVHALAHRLSQIMRGDTSEALPNAARQVLLALARNGPQNVPALAKMRNTSRQNIQVLVDRLVQQGCLVSATNPAHKSSPLFHLTEQGRALLGSSESDYLEWLKTHAAKDSASKLTEASRILRDLRLSLGTNAERRPPKIPKAPAAAATPVAAPEPLLPQSAPVESEIPLSLL